jgi:YVTN family beta-propeller protein
MNLRHWSQRQWMACLLFIPSLAGAAPFAYITNGSLPGTVSVIDTASDTVVNTIAVGVDPSGVAVSASGARVYVSNSFSSSVSVIDATTNTVVATVPGIAGPRGVAVNPAGTRAYVGHVGPTSVAVIDTATNSIAGNIPVSGIPLGLAMNAAGTAIYVVGADTNSISVIDVATNTVVKTVAVPSPAFVAVNPAGTRVYVTDDASNSVAIIDTATNTVVGSVGVGAEPAGVAVNPAGTRVYVANAKSDSISVIDSVSNAVIATVPVGKYPGGVAVNPAGTRVYVANTNSNNVSVVDATSNAVIATIPVGQFPVAFGQFIGPAVVTPPAANPDLNQHGLTGSWYESVSSGQGVEVEVFANPSSGTGSTFVSWFTYDTVIGGAERQRWYTAQGPVVTGQPTAALTIYQNTGGNFNAPPVTNAQVVGTATLSFDTCTTGQLTYSFTDGTGRSGAIPLTRLTQNVTCSTTSPHPTNSDFALSGNWYGGAATSGQGFTVEVNPNSGAFFSAWYTYMPSGSAAGASGQRWYTAQGAFTPGMRSIPVTI